MEIFDEFIRCKLMIKDAVDVLILCVVENHRLHGCVDTLRGLLL